MERSQTRILVVLIVIVAVVAFAMRLSSRSDTAETTPEKPTPAKPAAKLAPSEVQLSPRKLPGLEVSVPDWEVAEEAVMDDSGRVILAAPGSPGRFVQVRWFTGPPMDRSTVITTLTRDGSMHHAEIRKSTVEGGEVDTLIFEGKGAQGVAAVTQWHCAGEGISVYLLSFLAAERDAVLALHDRMLGRAKCVTRDAANRPKPLHPSFTPPEGYVSLEDAHSLVFSGPNNDVYRFAKAAPGRMLAGTLDANPQLAADVIEKEFELENVDLDPSPVATPRSAPDARKVWMAGGTSATGVAVRILVTWWYCPERNVSFVGLHRASPETDPVGSADRLLGARCP